MIYAYYVCTCYLHMSACRVPTSYIHATTHQQCHIGSFPNSFYFLLLFGTFEFECITIYVNVCVISVVINVNIWHSLTQCQRACTGTHTPTKYVVSRFDAKLIGSTQNQLFYNFPTIHTFNVILKSWNFWNESIAGTLFSTFISVCIACIHFSMIIRQPLHIWHLLNHIYRFNFSFQTIWISHCA